MSPPIRSILGLLLLSSGFDIHAQHSIDPQLLSFGDQLVGTQSAPLSVMVRNNTNNILVVAHGGPTDPAFAAASNCLGFPEFFFIGPRGSCAIQYTFSPTNEGPYSAAAAVRATGSFNSVSVQLTGNGAGVAVVPEVVHADGFEAPADISRW